MTQSTPPHPVLEKYYPSDTDRQSFVGALFDGAARHYNRIGTMLDLGSGPWYRRWALRRAGLRPGMRLLDVATGTGLVAHGAVGILGEPGVSEDHTRGHGPDVLLHLCHGGHLSLLLRAPSENDRQGDRTVNLNSGGRNEPI
jgi:hypothetical protein